MKKTNVYLEEDQLRLLKQMAVEQGRSYTELVRQAIREFLEGHQRAAEHGPSTDQWSRRLEQLLARVQERISTFPPEEIEAYITAASQKSRRRRSHATRPR